MASFRTRIPRRSCSFTLAHKPSQRTAATASILSAYSAPDLPPTNVAAIQRYPPLQPPSHKPPELRKSQLHRSYQSLLQSSPLLLLFQHNNLKANEWAGLRRELTAALQKVSAANPSPTGSSDPAVSAKLQVIQTGIFAAALRVVEFYNPSAAPSASEQGSASIHATEQHAAKLTHGLSRAAHRATMRHVDGQPVPKHTPLDSMLSGPLAVLSFPSVTPAHLAAALRVLAPTAGAGSAFPAPKRKASPGYYEPAVQAGLQKLMLLGARVEGKVMDRGGVEWMGGIQGGLDGLRAQLVATLQSAGMGLAGALQGATVGLWATVESRRLDMEGKTKAEETGSNGGGGEEAK